MDSNETIKLNEQVISQEEFEKRKQEVEQMKDAQLVEVAPNEYKIRLRD
jgi:hypothetical protein